MEEESIAYWLCTRPGIGIKKARLLLEKLGSLSAVYEAEPSQFLHIPGLSQACIRELVSEAGRETAQREWEELRKRKIGYFSCFGKDYPERLRWLYQPPKHLYVKGKLPEASRRAVGIVGARDCTSYGRDMARLFGCRLARAGVEIISGMAKGIDGWAHQGALEGGGRTYAVLGCGVEVCYPAEHRRLYESIQKNGGILSEFPIEMKAKAAFFPMRNRIISGLSDGILVVEARERSGSLITADAALEQGKDVFVVPGRIGDVLSVGCNRLIRQGAIPVTAPEEILEYYGIDMVPDRKREYSDNDMNICSEEASSFMEGMGTVEEKILACAAVMPIHIDALAATLKVSRTDVMKGVLRLKKENKLRETARGYFMCY
ncbi:MAG: DNA-processing protein DprA [Lachnospiraceae bacterium]|nr:DNA-processing protein DprA [Lachnospiraceae bacterium]